MVDTLALGASGGNPVKVQVLSSAPEETPKQNNSVLYKSTMTQVWCFCIARHSADLAIKLITQVNVAPSIE